MAIEYRSQPGHVKNFIDQHNTRFVGWDLDGTLANTERLHRALCRSALQEMSGQFVSEREFNSPRYRAAFGLPGGETSMYLAKHLRDTHPQGFQNAERFARLRGGEGESVEIVAKALTELRNETFATYVAHAKVRHCHEERGSLYVEATIATSAEDPVIAQRLEVLKDVRVQTYPYVMESISTFASHGLTQGVCTSSGAQFVVPLLALFGLSKHFAAIVTADCVPQGKHKPAPYPWHQLRARLDPSAVSPDESAPIHDMIFIENSAGGGLSSIRAGTGPTFIIADNISSTMGKMHAKVRALEGSSPHPTVHGKAIFIDNLGALVLPPVPSC
jgi:beta-phosphoglucomutase-like phosphatase (HAD superfamily)